ncbi:MAG: hypothetical protein ABL983_10290 [Nitrospira sp.]
MPETLRKQLLQDYFSDECAFIGEDTVDAILTGTYKPIKTQRGENMPVEGLVVVVTAAVGFIDSALSLYDRMKREESINRPMDELVQLIRSKLQVSNDIDDDVVVEVIKEIVRESHPKR